MKIFSHTITNPRDNFNKDRFAIKKNWFTVCDGVSSAGEKGAQAAQIAVNTVLKTNLDSLKNKTDLKKFLFNISKEIGKIEGATTFTSVLFKNKKGILFHTGDSECYVIYSDNTIKELTTPFTIRYAMYLMGKVEKDTVKTGYLSNYLLECLDGNSFTPQILQFDLSNIKAILLCTDGANNVPEDEAKTLILTEDNPAIAIAIKAQKLGSKDDITCIVMKF